MANTSDVLIIGGGCHGASLAFHLAQKGLKVIVLEKKTIASGATGRSSGLVRMHYDLEPEARLAWVSFKYFDNWKEIVGGECGFEKTGFIQIVPEKFIEQMKKNVLMHQRIGIDSNLVTADEVRELAPDMIVEDIAFAAYERESGYADAYAVTYSFMKRADEMGAVLKQGCEVTAIHVSGGKVTGVSTNRGEFSAPVVVNAAGPWAAPIAMMAGLKIPVTTWRHDTMFIKRPPNLGLVHPVVIDDINDMYFRPETGGLTLVGLEDGNPIGDDPDGFTDKAQAGFVERAVERMCLRVPAMEDGAVHSHHGGFDGLTPDQRAIIGQAGPEGFYLQCGMSGTGFKIAPAVGACMAELIEEGKVKTVDITPFRFERFEEGDLLEGEHSYDSAWK